MEHGLYRETDIMQLFVEDTLSWGKLASAELEEDATQWPRQVLTELFRALPEVSEYTPEVKFMHTNEEQGYALGVVVITNATNTALSAEGAGRRTPKALIPILIKSGRLCPLDIVMSSSGRMYPLTADRVREILYRPEPFDMLSDDWNDSSIWQLFQPPGRGDFGTGSPQGGSPGQGIQYMMGPGMKSASAGDPPELLPAIRDMLLQPHLDALTERLNGDPLFLKTASDNHAFLSVLALIANAEGRSEKTAAAYHQVVLDSFPVQVAQLGWDGASYAVKTANRDAGIVREYKLDRGEFLRFAGEKIAEKVDTQGTVHVSEPKADKPESVLVGGPRGERPKRIDTSGRWTVYEAQTGKPHTGFVFTGLVDTDGNRVPICVFVSEDGCVIQDQMAGATPVPSGPDAGLELPNDPPKGEGVFLVSREAWDMVATVPVTVKGSVSSEDARRYHCTDLSGEEVTIVAQRGAQGILAFPKRKEIIVPFGAAFIATSVKTLPPMIAEAPEDPIPKYAAARMLTPLISVTALGDDLYNLSTRHLPKLASALPLKELSADDATFVLCAAGLSTEDAYRALDKAAACAALNVVDVQDFGSLPVIDKEKIASFARDVASLRVDLSKEAAALSDPMTIDAVLSLDFINSENVRTFISMIPYLEKALNRVCELVFASRLGMDEIPEAAASRAARGMNDAIRGLKALALRQIEDLP
jgi:hypothetical protein